VRALFWSGRWSHLSWCCRDRSAGIWESLIWGLGNIQSIDDRRRSILSSSGSGQLSRRLRAPRLDGPSIFGRYGNRAWAGIWLHVISIVEQQKSRNGALVTLNLTWAGGRGVYPSFQHRPTVGCWRFTKSKNSPKFRYPCTRLRTSANQRPLFCCQMASAPTSAASQQLTACPAPRIDSVLFAFYLTLSELIRYNVHPRFCPSKNGRPSNLLPFLLTRIEVRWSGFEYSIFN
jgi:hypothetical protein